MNDHALRPAAPDELLDKLVAGLVFLAEAGELLSSSLDYRTTLRTLASLAVPRLADWCAVEMKHDDGTTEQVAVAHVDPAKVRLAREIREKYPTDPRSVNGVHEVMRSGKSQMLADIPETLLTASAKDADHLELIKALQLRSALVVPVAVRGRVLGALTLVFAESDRRYVPSDLTLAEQIGARAGLAIDNAQLYARTQALADRSRLLADISSTIAHAGLDVRAVGTALVERVRNAVGDACTLAMVDEKAHEVHILAVDHRDPDARDALRSNQSGARTPLGASVAGKVALSGKSMLVKDFARSPALADVHPAWSEYLVRFPIRSVIAVPVPGARGTIAVLSLSRHEPSPPFTSEDLAFVEEVARHVGLALDNSRLYADAQKAIRIRDEFLSVASHELRTPLTTIQLLVSGALLPGRVHELKEDKLRKLDVHLEKMKHLIDSFMDVSRLSAGKLPLERKPVNLGALVKDVVGRFDDAAVRAKCALSVDVQGETTGHWDPDRIDQVVTNLVSNGLKYGAGKPVAIVVSGTAASVRVVVSDEGIGIAADDQVRIFKQFERAASARNFGGMGLGLWISAQIVNAHSGRISVTSTLDVGSRFLVELPREEGSHG